MGVCSANTPVPKQISILFLCSQEKTKGRQYIYLDKLQKPRLKSYLAVLYLTLGNPGTSINSTSTPSLLSAQRVKPPTEALAAKQTTILLAIYINNIVFYAMRRAGRNPDRAEEITLIITSTQTKKLL
jgi:hypothetical protein